MKTELLKDIIRSRFEEPITNSPLEESANLIQLAVDLKLDKDFRREMIQDLESDMKEHNWPGFWWQLLDEDTDPDAGRPDTMTESKERKLNS